MSSVFPGSWLSAPTCKWRGWSRCSLSVCQAGPGRLTQLHIIRRPWIEDSKVLKVAGSTQIITADCPCWWSPQGTAAPPPLLRHSLLHPSLAPPHLWDPRSQVSALWRPQDSPCWPHHAMRSVPQPPPTGSGHSPVPAGNTSVCVTGPYW